MLLGRRALGRADAFPLGHNPVPQPHVDGWCNNALGEPMAQGQRRDQ